MIDLYTAGPRVSILYSWSYLILTTDIVIPILHETPDGQKCEVPCQKSQLASGSKPRFMTPSRGHSDLPVVLTREARVKAGKMEMAHRFYFSLFFTILSKVHVSLLEWPLSDTSFLPASFILTHEPVPKWVLSLGKLEEGLHVKTLTYDNNYRPPFLAQLRLLKWFEINSEVLENSKALHPQNTSLSSTLRVIHQTTQFPEGMMVNWLHICCCYCRSAAHSFGKLAFRARLDSCI